MQSANKQRAVLKAATERGVPAPKKVMHRRRKTKLPTQAMLDSQQKKNEEFTSTRSTVEKRPW